MNYYDDNFGHWTDTDDPDVVRFYYQVQREAVEKTCCGCERQVKLLPDYAYCNSCADKIESGWDI